METSIQFSTAVRFDPGHDTRDDIGPDDDPNEGRALGLGIIFELVADDVMLAWGINTGWFHRPVLTDGLRQGPQLRADRPGSDRAYRLDIAAYPNPLFVTVFEPERQWDLLHEDVRDDLMDALTSGGEEAVFSKLREVYLEHVR